MTWVMPSNIHEGRQFHLDGTHKHVENSRRGLRTAMFGPWDSWDGDLNKSFDEKILNNHWPDLLLHGFHDPKGEFNKDSGYTVGKHPASVTERFVADPGHYVVKPIMDRFIEAQRYHRPEFVFALEPKGSHWSVADMAELWLYAHAYKRPTIIKCAFSAPLVAAKSVGFQVRYTRDHRPGM